MEAFDNAAAEALRDWRPGLRGDPRTCDIQWLYLKLLPRVGPLVRLVEVGTHWGRSILYAAAVCVSRGYDAAELWAFDPFRGPGDPYAGFSQQHYGEALKGWAAHGEPGELELVRFCRAASPAAADLFDNHSLDLVLIDGCHSFEAVSADIRAWWPKVKHGGVLAGHDCTAEFPGVQRAVGLHLGPAVGLWGTCWLYPVRWDRREAQRIDPPLV